MDRRVAAAGLAVTMACSTAPSPSQYVPTASPPAAGFETGQDPQTRLRRGLADQPAMKPPGRNPFRFASESDSGRSSSNGRGATPLRSADDLPMLPLPLPQPPLRLLGLITMSDGKRVAAIAVGSDLVLAATGETIAGRFRIGQLGEDSVELTDAVGERPIRLSLP